MLVSKLRSGTSKAKAGPGGLVPVVLFWKSHCETCSMRSSLVPRAPDHVHVIPGEALTQDDFGEREAIFDQKWDSHLSFYAGKSQKFIA